MAKNMITFFGLLMLLPFVAASQNNDNYSFLVAGHGYGAHAGTNIGLHPPFLEKLPGAISPEVFALFLTGDLVNQSTAEAWKQVNSELETIGISSYYCMGNHDSNSEGYNAFNEKHGGTYYTFNHSGDCFIVLNSTITERSISPDQLQFLRTTLQNNASSERVFIFFHEVLWNSDLKYKDVLSNSRSRYGQIKRDSNFWTEVCQILSDFSDKKYYLFAGDVGGNTDAISAFFDVEGNLTFLASGMGEVADENFLSVDVMPDTVLFTFVPLREGISMHEASYYTIPDNPGTITGPAIIDKEVTSAKYSVSRVFNATSYAWILPEGVTGNSDSSFISVLFSDDFRSDTLSVYAVHHGYGMSQPSKLAIQAQQTQSAAALQRKVPFDVDITKQHAGLTISITSRQEQIIDYSIFDLQGKCLESSSTLIHNGTTAIRVEKLNLSSPLILVISNGKEKITKKITGNMLP
jgi:hypothetical protein